MMQRLSWFERDSIDRLEREAGRKAIVCQLTAKSSLPEEELLQAQSIRTDLNAFSNDEVNCLMQHGYDVADAALESAGLRDGAPPLPRRDGNARYDLRNSHKLRVIRSLFSFKEWTSWAALTLILAYIGLLLSPFWYITSRARKDAEEANKTASELERRLRDTSDRLQKLQLQNDHVNAGVKMIEELAELAGLVAYNSAEELEHQVRRWNESLSVQNGFYSGVTTSNVLSEIRGLIGSPESTTQSNRALVAVPDKEKLKPVVLGLAHNIRKHLLAADPAFQRILQERRRIFYDETMYVTGEIIEWSRNHPPAAVILSRNRFLVLYWGLLGLVEGRDVAGAMVDFGEPLNRWEATTNSASADLRSKMETARENLIKNIRVEVAKDIEAW
jgi:hypothetical protein